MNGRLMNGRCYFANPYGWLAVPLLGVVLVYGAACRVWGRLNSRGGLKRPPGGF